MSVISGIVQNLRRLAGGAAGAPASLLSGQLFSNEAEKVIYIGTGNNGSGVSTAQVKVGGSGAFADLSSAQTIAGVKTFSASPLAPTPALSDNSTAVATTAWVNGRRAFRCITELGAVPNNQNNASANTAIFQAAGASGYVYLIPDGVWWLSDTATVGTANGGGFIGAGSRTTTLMSVNASTPVVRVNDNSTHCIVRGLTLIHYTPTSAGGNGLDTGSGTGNSLIEDILSDSNNIGVVVRSSAFGTFRDVTVQNSTNDGFFISNTASLGAAGAAVQWKYINTMSQANGGCGFNFSVSTGTGTAGMILLPLTDLSTYANKAQGIKMLGAAGNGIDDVRIIGGFFGTDNLQEMYFDTYGQSLTIQGCMCEINTNGDTIYLTANNDHPQIIGVEVSNPPSTGSNLGNGIVSNAAGTIVSMCHVWSLGSPQDGIVLNGTDSQVFGGYIHGFSIGVNITGVRSSLFGPMLLNNSTHARTLAGDTNEVASCPQSKLPA